MPRRCFASRQRSELRVNEGHALRELSWCHGPSSAHSGDISLQVGDDILEELLLVLGELADRQELGGPLGLSPLVAATEDHCTTHAELDRDREIVDAVADGLADARRALDVAREADV